MGTPAEVTPKLSKSEQTRSLILQTALDLFRERGYEETTMRAIAERANISLGNTYYYFKSKEVLIQEFYAHTHGEHVLASTPVLAQEKTLKGRLLGVMKAKLTTIQPYHAFSGVLFKTAADPKSPLNPFSEDSTRTREESTELFAEVLRGAKGKVPLELQSELANLLWVYHMGVVLFWIHDNSPGCRRTHLLVDHTVDIIVKLIALASTPLLIPLRKKILRMMLDLRQTAGEIGTPDTLPVKLEDSEEFEAADPVAE